VRLSVVFISYSSTFISRINLRGFYVHVHSFTLFACTRVLGATCLYRTRTLDSHAQTALRTYPFEIVRDPLSFRITIAREWKPCVRPIVVASFAKFSRITLCRLSPFTASLLRVLPFFLHSIYLRYFSLAQKYNSKQFKQFLTHKNNLFICDKNSW